MSTRGEGSGRGGKEDGGGAGKRSGEDGGGEEGEGGGGREHKEELEIEEEWRRRGRWRR